MSDRSATADRHHASVPGLRHWFLVAALTVAGLYLAEFPVLSHTRDRVYLWLQRNFRSPQKSVVIVAIDDDEFWNGPPRFSRPLDRQYLLETLKKIAEADPAVIGVDVGLEVPAPKSAADARKQAETAKVFLAGVAELGKLAPVILPATIAQIKDVGLTRQRDLFRGHRLPPRVRCGHTNSAEDIRNIPTRIVLADATPIDSFALATFRTAAREMPPELDEVDHPWPYSFFLPLTAFVPPGMTRLLTPADLRAASLEQRKAWLQHQVVLFGGTWHRTPHGGDLEDGHVTPVRMIPGVITQADYVQSLLWGAMYGVPERARVAIEIVLSLAVAIILLLTHGWRRYALVAASIVFVVLVTWIFSTAIGIFFDIVVPIAFLGVHAIFEEASENLRLDLGARIPHLHAVSTILAGAIAVTLATMFAVHLRERNEAALIPEQRLQVTELEPPTSDRNLAEVLARLGDDAAAAAAAQGERRLSSLAFDGVWARDTLPLLRPATAGANEKEVRRKADAVAAHEAKLRAALAEAEESRAQESRAQAAAARQLAEEMEAEIRAHAQAQKRAAAQKAPTQPFAGVTAGPATSLSPAVGTTAATVPAVATAPDSVTTATASASTAVAAATNTAVPSTAAAPPFSTVPANAASLSVPMQLRYSVTIGTFENLARGDGARPVPAALRTALAEQLKQSDRFAVCGPTTGAEPGRHFESFFPVDDLPNGREHAQFLVTGVVTDVKVLDRPGSGGLTMKGISVGGTGRRAGKVDVRIDIYDAVHGKLIASKAVTGASSRSALGPSVQPADVGDEDIAAAIAAASEEAIEFLGRQANDVAWMGMVLATDGAIVAIDRGRAEGVAKGQQFIVLASTPDSGPLGGLSVELARLEVSAVEEHVALCVVVSGDRTAVRAGMSVRTPVPPQ